MSEQDQTADATSEVDTTSTDVAETTSAGESEETTSGEDALGDAGKQALDRMKERVKVAEKAAREAATALRAREAADALRDKPAEEQAIEAARAEARAEATIAANKRILRADLRALATGKLADPSDAALYINLDDFTVGDDGETDSDALNEAITELLEKKPHLAAQKQNRFDGAADQGAKNKDSQPQQLTQADLDRMVAAGDTDGIEKARVEGRFDTLLGIKKS